MSLDRSPALFPRLLPGLLPSSPPGFRAAIPLPTMMRLFRAPAARAATVTRGMVAAAAALPPRADAIVLRYNTAPRVAAAAPAPGFGHPSSGGPLAPEAAAVLGGVTMRFATPALPAQYLATPVAPSSIDLYHETASVHLF